MATNRTFTMIKPDAVENGHTGAILEKINAAGFRIVALKKTQMTKADAETFYAVHSERPFFGELVTFMTRGPIIAAILEKENAVVTLVNDGLEAFNILNTYSFDIVILDIHMPELTGEELIHQKKDLVKNNVIPFFALTGNATQEYRTNYMEIGFAEVIFKPYRPDELIHKIVRFL